MIEKFNGSFSKQELGVTQLPTKTIQSIKDSDALAYWVYLASKPHGWSPNQNEIRGHFGHGRDKSKKTINKLVEIGLMSVTQVRDKGKFQRNHFHLFLTIQLPANHQEKPLTEKPLTEKPLPLTEKPLTEKPLTVNQTHIKHRGIQNIDNIYKGNSEIVDNSDSHQDLPFSLNRFVKQEIKQIKKISTVDNDIKTALTSEACGVKTQLVNDWLEIRRVKGAPNTISFFHDLLIQLGIADKKHGMSPTDCLKLMINNGWSNLVADKIVNKKSCTGKNKGADIDMNDTSWFKSNSISDYLNEKNK